MYLQLALTAFLSFLCIASCGRYANFESSISGANTSSNSSESNKIITAEGPRHTVYVIEGRFEDGNSDIIYTKNFQEENALRASGAKSIAWHNPLQIYSKSSNSYHLWRCYSSGLSSHFISTRSDCEGGGKNEGLLGFSMKDAGSNRVELFRWYCPKQSAHKVTNAESSALLGCTLELSLGYIFSTSPSPNSMPIHPKPAPTETSITPPPVARLTNTIYVMEGLFSAGNSDILYTKLSIEAEGFRNSGAISVRAHESIKLYSSYFSDSISLWRCYSSTMSSHFLSKTSDCEGTGTNEGLMGYSGSKKGDNLVEIFRWYCPQKSAHFVGNSISSLVHGQCKFEGSLGFVEP